MATLTLKCKDCGAEFVMTESEQAFYKEEGFQNLPVRCGPCRKARVPVNAGLREEYTEKHTGSDGSRT